MSFFSRNTSQEQYYERLKLLFLTSAFFCVIGAYTVARELKSSVFVYTVGKEYIPLIRFLAPFMLVPVVFLYSELVDKLRRYQLLCAYSAAFGLLGLLFAYLIGHPTIGIANTHESPYRLFGWIFYFFVEGYSPFVVSVFWAFANSINSPDEAKRSYGLMVSGSKIGGMLTAGFAWWYVTRDTGAAAGAFPSIQADVLNHQWLLVLSSLLLLVVPFIIMLMIKKIPGRYLHGYEAVYKAEKLKHAEGESQTGIFAGLLMLIKYPYVLGIFGMLFFYEIVSVVLSYLSVSVAKEHSSTASETVGQLFKIIFMTHAVGFIISFFGTSLLFQKLGTRRCLLLVPISSGLVLLYYILNVSSKINAIIIAVVSLKAINYAFSYPLRESLYIPTIKEIKFKSKSWIDAFGAKFAKSTGSAFNMVTHLAGSSVISIYSFFFMGIVGLWVVTAILLGKRFDQAVANKEVIGVEAE